MSQIIKGTGKIPNVGELMEVLGFSVDGRFSIRGERRITINKYDDLCGDFWSEVCYDVGGSIDVDEIFDEMTRYLNRGDVYYYDNGDGSIFISNYNSKQFRSAALKWLEDWLERNGVE